MLDALKAIVQDTGQVSHFISISGQSQKAYLNEQTGRYLKDNSILVPRIRQTIYSSRNVRNLSSCPFHGYRSARCKTQQNKGEILSSELNTGIVSNLKQKAQ